MSLHRSVVAAALAATLLTAGCSDDSSADPTPVTAGPTTSVAPTTTAGIETTTTTAAQAATSTTSASPPVTKPLTTAPPSELLTEVTAAYDAANLLIDQSFSVLGDANPDLSLYVAGPQLESWRTAILAAETEGVISPSGVTGSPWWRAEALERVGENGAVLTVCRFDGEQTSKAATGEIVSRITRAYRYLETFKFEIGEWKWVGREWIDPPGETSDCALP